MKIPPCMIFILLLSMSVINPALAEEIKLNSIGGVYTLPVRLNNSLTMDFLIDTGAADVGLSDDITTKLISTGVMAEKDFKGSEEYILADGSSVKCRTVMLRTVRIGGREVSDVRASACPGKPPLLLGQSFLKKLGPWSLDYGRNLLVVISDARKALEPPTYSPKDVEWHEKAGAQGNAAAQFNLAVIFEKGDGVPRNQAKAIELLKESAAQGYAPAQSVLAFLYETGDRVPKSAAKSFELYQKAAAQGFSPAQLNLGNMCREGQGTRKDIGKALEWYQKAAERGEDLASVNLGMMYNTGDGVTKDSAKAAEWFQKGADRGGLMSEYYLGIAYLNGEGVTADLTRGLDLLQKAAAAGLASAQRHLGSLYFSGNEVPKDKVLSWAWTQLASVGGKTQGAAYQGKTTVDEDLEFIGRDMTPAELAEARSLASGWKAGHALKRK